MRKHLSLLKIDAATKPTLVSDRSPWCAKCQQDLRYTLFCRRSVYYLPYRSALLVYATSYILSTITFLSVVRIVIVRIVIVRREVKSRGSFEMQTVSPPFLAVPAIESGATSRFSHNNMDLTYLYACDIDNI
jgi:hypothetical protein